MPMSQRMLKQGAPWEIKQANPEETEVRQENNHNKSYLNDHSLKACS